MVGSEEKKDGHQSKYGFMILNLVVRSVVVVVVTGGGEVVVVDTGGSEVVVVVPGGGEKTVEGIGVWFWEKYSFISYIY